MSFLMADQTVESTVTEHRQGEAALCCSDHGSTEELTAKPAPEAKPWFAKNVKHF
jgi:hypothetical protein